MSDNIDPSTITTAHSKINRESSSHSLAYQLINSKLFKIFCLYPIICSPTPWPERVPVAGLTEASPLQCLLAAVVQLLQSPPTPGRELSFICIDLPVNNTGVKTEQERVEIFCYTILDVTGLVPQSPTPNGRGEGD